MQLREATQADLQYTADHSTSRGQKEFPVQIDFIYCLEDNDKILGVGGVKLITPTVAWCWMDWTENAKTKRYSAYRSIYEWLNKFMEAKRILRLMAAVECDFPEAITTVQHLGFQQEGLMQNWVDGKPAYLYVRFAE